MDKFSTRDFCNLMEGKASPCISIYMPTYQFGEESPQNSVRLKNLLQQVENELADGWLRPADGRKMLQRARELISDSLFWEGCGRGLAMFLSPDHWVHFHLGIDFEEQTVVNRRFLLKPLIPLLNRSERFYILVLSQNNTRLFQASRSSIRQVETDAIPSNMEKALNYSSADRGSQTHSAARGRFGKQAAVFHGQGGQPDSHKDDVTQYFRLVDQGVTKAIANSERPLLLAGVDSVMPIYRRVSSYSNVVEAGLHGNFDKEPMWKLLEKAWSIMAPFFKAEYEKSTTRFRELTGTAKACDEVEKIVPAAYDGRVDTLFVDELGHQWGTYANESRFIELHQEYNQGDDDLLDLAAVETLSNKGSVYAVNRELMPANKPMVALMRY